MADSISLHDLALRGLRAVALWVSQKALKPCALQLLAETALAGE